MGARSNMYSVSRPSDIYSLSNPYFSPYSYPSSSPQPPGLYDDAPTTTLRGGTLLHKGFYDLLAMIPTPSPSRLLWGSPAAAPEPIIAGPRYEEIAPAQTVRGKPLLGSPLSAPPIPAKKTRRISKDMVSKPTGFVYVFGCRICFSAKLTLFFFSHLVHASDADQLEALLTRWGPDGLGKLGGQALFHRIPLRLSRRRWQIHAGPTPSRPEFDKTIRSELSTRL